MSLPWYFWILLLLYVGVSVFMILVILLQAGKGGGMSSLMGGGGGVSDSLGTTSADRTFKKLTKICAVSFCLLAIILTWIGSRHAGQVSVADQLAKEAAAEATFLPPPEDDMALPGVDAGPPAPEEIPMDGVEAVDEPETGAPAIAPEAETPTEAEAAPVE
jgi:preprotein translocase subunit SecG